MECVIYTALMGGQLSRAAAAAVEIPVLQRAPLACFMCVIMLDRAIPDMSQAIRHSSSTVAKQHHLWY